MVSDMFQISRIGYLKILEAAFPVDAVPGQVYPAEPMGYTVSAFELQR